MKSGNILPIIDPEAIEYAKTLGHTIDPYFPPVKTDSGIWALDGIASTRSGNKLAKNVNVGNRIFTDDTVTILSNSRYKITSANDFSSSLSPAQASFLSVLTKNQSPQKNFAIKP